jgi:hypothetical protein
MASEKKPCTERFQSPPMLPLLLLSQPSFWPLPPSLWLLLPLLLSTAKAQSIQGFVYWDSDLNGILSEGVLDPYGTFVHGECISALLLLLFATMKFVSIVQVLEDGLASPYNISIIIINKLPLLFISFSSLESTHLNPHQS